MTEPRLLISTTDRERLQRLIEQHQDGHNAEQAELLEHELQRAHVMPPDQLPPGVVGMNSTVVFEDEETHVRREVTLSYPAATDGAGERVSVLAPVGSALLGLSVGQSIEWTVPNGRRRFRIVAASRGMDRHVEREDRWQNLVLGALRLEEQLDGPTEGRDRVMGALLDNVLEVFPATVDPVEDFEGFAVRRFAQALRRAIETVPARGEAAGLTERLTTPC